MMKNMYRNDEALTIRLNMPGTGKTVTSDPIHIGQKGGIDSAVISLTHEALPALAAGKTMTLTVESSEDGADWAELDAPKLTATAPRATAPPPAKCSCVSRWRLAPGCA